RLALGGARRSGRLTDPRRQIGEAAVERLQRSLRRGEPLGRQLVDRAHGGGALAERLHRRTQGSAAGRRGLVDRARCGRGGAAGPWRSASTVAPSAASRSVSTVRAESRSPAWSPPAGGTAGPGGGGVLSIFASRVSTLSSRLSAGSTAAMRAARSAVCRAS